MIKKSALIIAGSDSSAGAGVQADLKTFSAFKVYAATVFTALTAQNTRGVSEVLNLPKNFIESQIKSVAEDLNISFIKIGMLSNYNIIKTIDYCLNKYFPKIPIVLDPVMVAKGGHLLLEDSAIKYLKRYLLKKSFLITPNLLEAEKILNCQIKNINQMKNSLNKFKDLGLKRVLLKGGHLIKEKDKVTDFLIDKESLFKYSSKRIKTKNTHGTGCSLASAVTANLLIGHSLNESVKIARKFVNTGIRKGLIIGKGHNPINHFVKI